jgi:tetratricopeptide (TPR) repeat protein
MRFINRTRDLKDEATEALHHKKFEKAIEIYYQVLEIDPVDLWARQKIAECFVKVKKIPSAVREYNRAAHLYMDRGKLKEALSLFKLASGLDPSNVEASLNVESLEDEIRDNGPFRKIDTEEFDVREFLENRVDL